MDSYLQILGISGNTSADEVTHQWNKLMLRYHPDKNPGNEDAATEHTKLINDAYERVMKSFEAPSAPHERQPFSEPKHEPQPFSEPKHNPNIPPEKPEEQELLFESLSQLCEYCIFNIAAADESANELLQSYRKKPDEREAQIYYLSQIKSKISAFMTQARNSRHSRVIRADSTESWWREIAVLKGVHADLSAKLDVVVELNSRLAYLFVEHGDHVLSEEQWKRQTVRLKETAAWIGTQL